MRPWRIGSLVLVFMLLSGLAVGCGVIGNSISGAQQAPKTWTNPPFTDSRKMEVVTPDPAFDVTTANRSLYTQVKVLDKTGKQVTLNAANHPLLFEAYWCPHCQRTLVALNDNRGKLHQFPIVVSMGFSPGTPLSQAVKISHQELAYFHISGVQVYYLLDPNESKQVLQSYPTMVFPYQSHLDKLTGEHTPQVWEKALNQS